MSRPIVVSDEHRNIGGPGIAEAMASPEHLRVTGFQCVDYGPEWDEVPREQPRDSLLDRLRRRRACRG